VKKYTVVVPPKEAGDGFGQMQSVTSHKVRKDALHLPKPNLATANLGLEITYVELSTY
jgi:hypothetical protein